MKEKSINIPIRICSFAELPEKYQQLVESAKQQTQHAYAPYSNFRVGAAVLLNNGVVVGGSNQENAAYPSGLCAERVTVFAANAQYPEIPVRALAIAAFTNGAFLQKPIPPCGACRQVLLEVENRFGQDFEIILYGENEIMLIKRASDLLPIQFSQNNLNNC
ncbi:MAG: cytidine deaminase [Prevotellaceae bacterium]|jgi:cytidine deaminase|nr:cytidine deaminase [Prevotellaceae bacterium]